MRFHHWLSAALVLFAVSACDQPLPTAVDEDAAATPDQAGLYASSAGMTVTSVDGTIGFAGAGPPARVVDTPSGVLHTFDWPVLFQFTGDVEGLVTFHEQHHDMGFDDTMLIISGPLDGAVTWNGLTGPIEGRFKLNCRVYGTPPPTCVTKVMNARGYGELEGVLFRFDVEPGWIPFNYSGKVFSK